MHSRVANSLILAPTPVGRDRIAWRHLCSFLAHVEEAAILHSLNYGVPGQLEDEQFHQATFAAMAERYGGLEPIRPEVQALLDFLKEQTGDTAKFLFQIVAEGWLHIVFDALAEKFEVFREIEKDEARHAACEIQPFDNAADAVQVLRRLEELLAELVESPFFLAPLAHLMGVDGAAKIGLRNIKNHEEVCRKAGVTPNVEQMKDKCERAVRAVERGLPTELKLNEWQITKMRTMKKQPYMMDSVVVPMEATNNGWIEAEVVQTMGRILSRRPELNTTVRDGRLFRPAEIVIGVRRQYDRLGDRIVTVYLRNPHLHTIPEIQTQVAEKLKRLRDRRYKSVPEYEGLEAILPAPRCSVVLTQCMGLGVRNGFAAHIEDEGAAISMCLGLDGKDMFIGYTVDHRACDGREIGALSAELTREFRG